MSFSCIHNDMHKQLHIDKCTADSAYQYRMYCTRLCAQVLDQCNLRTLEACAFSYMQQYVIYLHTITRASQVMEVRIAAIRFKLET